MDQLVDRLDDARQALEAKAEVRDTMLRQRRDLISGAQEVVNLVHQGRHEEASDRYQRLLDDVATVRETVEEHPDLWRAGALRNALQEVAEAWALLVLVGMDAELPEEATTHEALVLGLADTVGEIRRRALDDLIEDDVDAAIERVEQMERLFEELRKLDVPSGLVDHRHKVDVARQLVDKTRGKVALGRIEQRMRARSETHG